MSGRGGRNKTTLSREQLQALTIKGNDCLPVILEPPPTFPPLMTKHSTFPVSKEYEARTEKIYKYKRFMFKRQFLDNFDDNSLLAKKANNYTDDNNILESKIRKQKFIRTLRWDQVPEELRMQTTGVHKKLCKTVKDVPDIEKRLDELAAKENSTEITVDEAEDKTADSDKDGEDEELNEEQEDEEFDTDNDYGNNYFDNGEAYDDNAEEPLDDGPIF